MKLLPTLLSLTLVLSTASSCATYTKQAVASDEKITTSKTTKAEMSYEHFTLPNGLNVYLTKNDQTPRFRAEFAVRTGSKRDHSDATGIANYLEHMLFKET